MRRPARLIAAAAALATAGLFAAAPAANAVIDPVALLECVTSSATELTTLAVPTEIPLTGCLAP
ncbi:hypothetical protein [Nonomuraea aridisoli]|nr:hypothetical protein [Nonomuraea aridisoli]